MGRAPLAVADARADVWERIEELGGIQWPCTEESHPGALFLHGRLWAFDDPEAQGMKAPFSVVIDDPPVDTLDEEFPIRLTTGRRLESFNTGVQTERIHLAAARGESLDLSPRGRGALGSRGRGRADRVASRRDRGAGAHRRRRCAKGWRS